MMIDDDGLGQGEGDDNIGQVDHDADTEFVKFHLIATVLVRKHCQRHYGPRR